MPGMSDKKTNEFKQMLNQKIQNRTVVLQLFPDDARKAMKAILDVSAALLTMNQDQTMARIKKLEFLGADICSVEEMETAIMPLLFHPQVLSCVTRRAVQLFPKYMPLLKHLGTGDKEVDWSNPAKCLAHLTKISDLRAGEIIDDLVLLVSEVDWAIDTILGLEHNNTTNTGRVRVMVTAMVPAIIEFYARMVAINGLTIASFYSALDKAEKELRPKCTNCEGKGWIKTGEDVDDWVDCPACNGTVGSETQYDSASHGE